MNNTHELTKIIGRDGSVTGYWYRGVKLVSITSRSVVYGCRMGYSFAQTMPSMMLKRALAEIDKDIARGMTVVDGNLL